MLEQIIEARGWKLGQVLDHDSCTTIWYKSFALTPPCRCNGRVNINIKHYVLVDGHVCYEIDLVGERPNGAWVKYMVFGLGNLDHLDDHITTLCNAWSAK